MRYSYTKDNKNGRVPLPLSDQVELSALQEHDTVGPTTSPNSPFQEIIHCTAPTSIRRHVSHHRILRLFPEKKPRASPTVHLSQPPPLYIPLLLSSTHLSVYFQSFDEFFLPSLPLPLVFFFFFFYFYEVIDQLRMGNHKKLLQFLRPADTAVAAARLSDDDDDGGAPSSVPPSPMSTWSGRTSAAASPSPYVMSPWVNLPGFGVGGGDEMVAGGGGTGLLGSLVKEDGHVYSLAAAGELLYTGTDSKNVRVWRHRREFAGFRSGSGLVKAIVVAGDGRIYTGHQDGKVRVWRASADDPAVHRRVGSLPGLGDVLRSAVRPSRYVETRRRHSALWLRHFDAVSCLSLDAAAGLLYSGRGTRRSRCGACRTRGASSRCGRTTTPSTRWPPPGSTRWCSPARRTGRSRCGGGAGRAVPRGTPWSGCCGRAKRGHRHRRGRGGARRVRRLLGRRRHALAVAARRRRCRRATEERRALRGHRMAVLCLAVAGRVVVRLRRPDDLRVAARGGRRPRQPRRARRPHGPRQVRRHGRGGRHRRRQAVGGLQRQPGRLRQGVARLEHPDAAAARTPAHGWKATPSPLGAWTPYAATPARKRMAAA